MGRKQLPLLQVLDLAIGTPEQGCLNLSLVHVVLKALIMHNEIGGTLVDAEDIGLPDGFDFGGGGVRDQKDMKNRTNDMWALLKVKKRVEANKEGIDRLFELLNDMINGDTPVLTWAKLDEHLHHGGEDTHVDLEKTLRDLEDAKLFFADDPDKLKEIEEKKQAIQRRKERFMAQTARKSSAAPLARRSLAMPNDTYDDFDDDDDADVYEEELKPTSRGSGGVEGRPSQQPVARTRSGSGSRTDSRPSSSESGQRQRSRSSRAASADPESAAASRPPSSKAESRKASPESVGEEASSRPRSRRENSRERSADGRPGSAGGRKGDKSEAGSVASGGKSDKSEAGSVASGGKSDKSEAGSVASGGKRDKSEAGSVASGSRKSERGERESRTPRVTVTGRAGSSAIRDASDEKEGARGRQSSGKRVKIPSPKDGTRPEGGGSSAAYEDSSGGRTTDSRASSGRRTPASRGVVSSSPSWIGIGGGEAAEDAQKTLGGLGQMALFRGATEHKLEMHEHQLKLLMRFRNTMVQGNLLTDLVKLLGGGGLEALNRLVAMEKQEGGGVESMKELLAALNDDLEDLLRQTQTRNDEVNEKLEDLEDKQEQLREEILRQTESIKELALQIEDIRKEIKLLKEKVAHLENIKADRLWVLMELSKKVDDAVLPTLVTQEEFKQNLEEIGESMNELVDKITVQSDVVRCHVQETSDALAAKLALGVFENFKEIWGGKVERLQRLLDEILGVTEGQEDAAFLKLMKFHCASCDRPSRMVKQPTTPALPAIQGMNKSKSAAPYAVFGQANIRKNLRNDNNNDGDILGASVSGILLTPLQRGNVVGYKEAVADQRRQWKEKVDRSKEGGGFGGGGESANGKGRGGPVGGEGLARSDRAVERKPVMDFANSAYYRAPEPGVIEDVYRQNRKTGGEFTKTVPPQKIVVEASPLTAKILDAPKVGYILGQKTTKEEEQKDINGGNTEIKISRGFDNDNQRDDTIRHTTPSDELA